MNLPKQNYFVRLDGATYDEKDLKEFLDIIKSGLPESFEVKTFSVLDYQQKSKRKSISLDKFFRGDYSLNVSRVFKYQETVRPVRMTNSPESMPLEEQIALIPKGDYVLIDDDTVSGYDMTVFSLRDPSFTKKERVAGFTINYIQALLSYYKINIVETEFILQSFGDYVDIIDLRDFIVGTSSGGLVEEFPDGQIARIPYLHPFINLTQRASILPEHAERVSSELWSFNQRYHAKHKDKFTSRTSMQSKIIDCLLPDENTDLLDFSQIVDLLIEKYLQKG